MINCTKQDPMLAKVKNYKGIEFIELDDLPLEQASSFKEWASRDIFIKIMIKDKVVSNCIQFKDYKRWYNIFHQKEQSLQSSLPSKKVVVLNKH